MISKDQLGRLIGGAFGLVFVEANASALPSAVGVVLRVLALAGFVGLIIVTLRRGHRAAPAGTSWAVSFGRFYWIVVAMEAVVGLAGIVIINAVLHAPRVTVAWIALVVGVHFFGLAAVWRLPQLVWLGAALATSGAAGLALGLYGSSTAAIALTGGIIPGIVLLGFAWGASSPAPSTVRP